MSGNARCLWPATRLPTVKESPIAASELSSNERAPAAGTAYGETGDQLHTTVMCQPSNLESHGARRSFHERRSSAPPPAAMGLPGQRCRLDIDVDDVTGVESESVDSGVAEDDAGCRQSGGLITPRERRRSSWAAGAFQTLQPPTSAPGEYHEALPHDQLYKQFIQIRDAVLRKGQAGGGQLEKRSEGADGMDGVSPDSLQGSVSGEDVALMGRGYAAASAHGNGSGNAVGLANLVTPACAAKYSGEAPVVASTTESPPDSPYKSAVAIAAYAACAGQMAQPLEVLAPAGSNGVVPSGDLQLAGSNGRVQRRPHQSPEMVNLQDYYLSPAASSCGTGQRMSPFEGAVAAASDCVSYNELYGRAAARLSNCLAAPAPHRHTSAKEVVRGRPSCGPLVTINRMEVTTSMPGTSSLFSLLPSGEPQPSVSPFIGEVPSQQQQPSQPVDSGTTAGTSSQVLPWQGDPAVKADGSAAALVAGQSGGRYEALQPVETASSSFRLSMRDSRSTNPAGDSEAEATDSRGIDVVVRGGRGGNDGYTPDYLKAVQSAAQRTLLPLSRVQSGSSVRSGGPSAPDCHALLNSGWAAVAATSNSATTPHSETAKAGGEEARPTYNGYVSLPLSGLPPPPAMPMGTEQSALPLSLSMHSTASVAAATAAVVRKCLDKGFPFAVIPVKHFASVMTAAEQHDGPLAYHIMSTHGVYYPGMGRHAASSGGASAFSGVGAAGCTGSSSGASTGSTPSKPGASTAAAAAAACVRQLLASGDALHVVSPGEYQRTQLAAQYSLRQLHDILVAQPPVLAGAQSVPSARQDPAPGPVAQETGAPRDGGRVLRQHRRGSSICNESNFSSIVRFQSGLEGQGSRDLMATPAHAGDAGVLSTAVPSDSASRVKTLIQAAQLGNMARVAFLVKHGVDVNAVESAQQQQNGTPQGVRGALAGAFAGGGAAAGGRTALHYAALAGSFGVVQLLLHHGAFVGVRDGTGRTAYDLARRKGHDAVAQLLRDAAERRREVVHNCPAESRATATAAPRIGYPPPVPPRSKQLRSNSAPASGATMDGSATTMAARGATAAVATTEMAEMAPAAATVGAGMCVREQQGRASPLPCSSPRDILVCQPAGVRIDCGSALVATQLSSCSSAAPGLKGCPSGQFAEVQLPAAPSKEVVVVECPAVVCQAFNDAVDSSTLQTPAVMGPKAARPEPEAHEYAGPVHRKGGLLACFLCGA